MERTLNKEMFAKLGKAVIISASMAGYTLSPEQLNNIAELAGCAISIVYMLEAWWKSGKN